MRIATLLSVILAMGAWCGAAIGQPGRAGARDVVIAPAAPATRALEWSLLVPPSEQTEGNAALVYAQAMPLLATISDDERRLLEAMARGDGTNGAEAARVMARLEGVLTLLEQGSYRADCDWGTPVRQLGPGVLVSEAPYLRLLGVVVAARARAAVQGSDVPGALRWIRAGVALTRNVAEGPTIVHGVMALSIAERMADLIEAFAGMQGAPGLSWALAELGERPIDLGPGLRSERSMLSYGGMSLERLDAARSWTADELERVDRLMRGEFPGSPAGGAPTGWDAAARAAAVYPRASALLLSRGWDRSVVQSMAVREVGVRYQLAVYLSLRDELFKWMEVPYPDGRQGLERAHREIRAAQERGDGGAMAAMLPDLGSLALARARVERRFAMLRAVEAVREHAGASGSAGGWPSSLDAVAGVRVPRDPMSGRPFVYRVEGPTAVIADDGSAGERTEIRLRIRR